LDQGPNSEHRVNASGKMQVIHIFRAGETFAEAALAENTYFLKSAVVGGLFPTDFTLGYGFGLQSQHK
jgi:hypothetical protein